MLSYTELPSTVPPSCIPAEHTTDLCIKPQILATKDKDEAAESFKDDLTLTVREAQPLVLTPSQVKNMTLDDMVSIWKVCLPAHPSFDLYSDAAVMGCKWITKFGVLLHANACAGICQRTGSKLG